MNWNDQGLPTDPFWRYFFRLFLEPWWCFFCVLPVALRIFKNDRKRELVLVRLFQWVRFLDLRVSLRKLWKPSRKESVHDIKMNSLANWRLLFVVILVSLVKSELEHAFGLLAHLLVYNRGLQRYQELHRLVSRRKLTVLWILLLLFFQPFKRV
jgi:hypothetical protein